MAWNAKDGSGAVYDRNGQKLNFPIRHCCQSSSDSILSPEQSRLDKNISLLNSLEWGLYRRLRSYNESDCPLPSDAWRKLQAFAEHGPQLLTNPSDIAKGSPSAAAPNRTEGLCVGKVVWLAASLMLLDFEKLRWSHFGGDRSRLQARIEQHMQAANCPMLYTMAMQEEYIELGMGLIEPLIKLFRGMGIVSTCYEGQLNELTSLDSSLKRCDGPRLFLIKNGPHIGMLSVRFRESVNRFEGYFYNPNSQAGPIEIFFKASPSARNSPAIGAANWPTNGQPGPFAFLKSILETDSNRVWLSKDQHTTSIPRGSHGASDQVSLFELKLMPVSATCGSQVSAGVLQERWGTYLMRVLTGEDTLVRPTQPMMIYCWDYADELDWYLHWGEITETQYTFLRRFYDPELDKKLSAVINRCVIHTALDSKQHWLDTANSHGLRITKQDVATLKMVLNKM